jgi:hypothetical protein
VSARGAGSLALCLALAVPGAALACGVCVEDKVAATYDYDVVQRAAARHHVVVFAAVEAPADPRVLRRAAAKVPGVERASVRAADSPRALSFALDPRKSNPLAALAAIEREPALKGVRLTLIQVMR